MHPRTTLFALLASLTPLAQAMTVDPKALARFDHSYVTCETKFPEMKGHRDEVYLSMRRAKPDQNALRDLAAVRQLATYRSEQTLVEKEGVKSAQAASSPLEHQCKALWAEKQGSKRERH
ncbi:MAG: hypothetical protein M3Z16_12155 [Pseudomonadota bacterium]|nr:hypothetical protein [Pseudomonadota bacterium]